MAKRNVIHRALSTHLNANFSGISTMAWENVKFTPETNQIWFTEAFAPVGSRQRTLGQAGSQEDFGIYQINTYVPTGEGTVVADGYINELSQIFKLGTTLTKDGEEVYIESSTPAQGFPDDAWYVIPFTVTWSSHQTIN